MSQFVRQADKAPIEARASSITPGALREAYEAAVKHCRMTMIELGPFGPIVLAEAWRVMTELRVAPEVAAAAIASNLHIDFDYEVALRRALAQHSSLLTVGAAWAGSFVRAIEKTSIPSRAPDDTVPAEGTANSLEATPFTDGLAGYFFVPWAEHAMLGDEVGPSWLEAGKPILKDQGWLGSNAIVTSQLTFDKWRQEAADRGLDVMMSELGPGMPPELAAAVKAAGDAGAPVIWALYNTYGRQVMTFEPGPDVIDYEAYCRALVGKK